MPRLTITYKKKSKLTLNINIPKY